MRSFTAQPNQGFYTATVLGASDAYALYVVFHAGALPLASSFVPHRSTGLSRLEYSCSPHDHRLGIYKVQPSNVLLGMCCPLRDVLIEHSAEIRS